MSDQTLGSFDDPFTTAPATVVAPALNPTAVELVDEVPEVAAPVPMPTITLDPEQEAAVITCCDLTKRIVCVSGEGGSGKTTIMRLAYEKLVAGGYSVMLLAPTGKAAKRVTEATGLPAMTIHRGLEYSHPGDRDEKTGKVLGVSVPKRDHNMPLNADVVIVDEFSMVNHEVGRNLFDAIKRGAVVRAFGDMNQLQPIEDTPEAKEGSPFAKLLKKFDGIVLKTNHRQLAGSGIATNCHLILSGKSPVRRDDFEIKFTEKPIDVLTDYVMNKLDQGVNFGHIQHQIITPMRKFWVGTHALNGVVQGLLSDTSGPSMRLPRHKWDKNEVWIRVGDKVICEQNIYNLHSLMPNDPLYLAPTNQLMNGESGVVTHLHDDESIEINLGDRSVTVPPFIELETKDGRQTIFDPRRELSLGYVITTHKAQGSEYDHVVYVLNKSSSYAQSRSNFYTAMSRTRKQAYLITDQRSFSLSVWKVEKR